MQDKQGNQDTLKRPADALAKPSGTIAHEVMRARKRRDPCNQPELAGTAMCRKNAAKKVQSNRQDRDDIYGPSGQ